MPCTLTYEEAMKEVKNAVSGSGSSFGAGMAVLSKEKRGAMHALYAFCRTVDDIADEGATREIRISELDFWKKRITKLFQNKEAEDAITCALLPAVERYELAELDFQDIILGMEMDAKENILAPDMATLDRYCDLVASAVGRASVKIFGENNDSGIKVAHHLGRALQLTNILRDLKEDAERGRLYLPKELLEKHSVPFRTVAEAVGSSNLKYVCRDLASLAESHFDGAERSMAECCHNTMLPARIMSDYYRAILEKLVKKDWRDLDYRAKLNPLVKICIVVKNIIGC